MDLKTTYSEGELISLMMANNRVGFDYLYARYAGTLVYCINRFVADDQAAQEILLDSFVTIWTKINADNPDRSCFYIWMHTIAKNKAIDYMNDRLHKNTVSTCGNEYRVAAIE